MRGARARILVALMVAWSLTSAAWAGQRAEDPDSAPATLPRAQSLYDQSRFDDAIALLRSVVDRDVLKGNELLRARELLARSYVKKGYPARARDQFAAILRQNPAYRPDPVRVPPDEAAVFELALRQHRAGGSLDAPKGGVSATSAGSANPSSGGVPRNFGMLDVRVRPFASYYVDDTLRASNVSHARILVRPGARVVRVLHPAYEAKEWRPQVTAGSVTKLTHDFLETSAGLLRVSSGEVWAEVLLDGRSTGKTTPCTLEGLSYGNHVVTVTRGGFDPEGGPQVISVKPGSNSLVSFRMIRAR